jgi:hypothetical protein
MGYTELLHLRARWYDVETGTFLSRDSVESKPPYLYASANPINFEDPCGYFKGRLPRQQRKRTFQAVGFQKLLVFH